LKVFIFVYFFFQWKNIIIIIRGRVSLKWTRCHCLYSHIYLYNVWQSRMIAFVTFPYIYIGWMLAISFYGWYNDLMRMINDSYNMIEHFLRNPDSELIQWFILAPLPIIIVILCFLALMEFLFDLNLKLYAIHTRFRQQIIWYKNLFIYLDENIQHFV
jgi:hypothetical protein